MDLIEPPINQEMSHPGTSDRQPVLTRDECVCLSTSSVLNQQAFMSNCGIPFAALIDLQSPAKTRLCQVARQPCRCKNCGAFLNCYCKTSLSKSNEPVWDCIICGTRNSATFFAKDIAVGGSGGGSLAELSDEAVEYVYPAPPPSPNTLHKRPHVCLLIDATMEPTMLSSLSLSILTDLLPSLDPQATLSIVSFDRCVCLHSLSSSHPHALTLPGAQAADRSLISHYVSHGSSFLGHDSSSNPLVADVASCSTALSSVLKSLRPMERDRPFEERSRCLGPSLESALWLMHYSSTNSTTTSTPQAGTTTSNSQDHPGSLSAFTHLPRGSCVIAAIGGPATRGPGSVSIESLRAGAPFYADADGGNRQVSSSPPPPLVPPIESTMSAKEMKKEASTAVDYFGSLADLAEDMGVSVSLLLLTSKIPSKAKESRGVKASEDFGVSFNVPALSMLAQDTRGLLIPCPLVGAGPQPGLSPSSSTLLSSSLKAAAAGAMAAGGTSPPSSCFGSSGILDAYVSDGLKLVQWLGPVDVLQSADVEDEPSLSMALDTRLSHSACTVIRLQEGQGAALRLELDRDLSSREEGEGGGDPFVVLQVVFQFVDPSIGGRLVQRVCTRKINVVSSLASFLSGLNPRAAAVAIAKRSALEAKKQYGLCSSDKADGVRYSLRAQLGLVASRCCKEEVIVGKGGFFTLGFGVIKAKKLNPQLLPIAHSIYSIVSGSLLAPPAGSKASEGPKEDGSETFSPQNADARLLAANALLSAGSKATLSMLLPPMTSPGLHHDQDASAAAAGTGLTLPSGALTLPSGALFKLYSTREADVKSKSPHRVSFEAWCLTNGIKV